MTPEIQPVTPQIPVNVATIATIGSAQLANGGGHIAGAVVVKVAGSTDCVATLYDGTSTSGIPLAQFGCSSVGPASMCSSSFATGLFVNVIGTTAATFDVPYTGTAA
ncbi:MAG: hypothetical protein ACREFJ_04950 [Acetobacteraceae bacterium]